MLQDGYEGQCLTSYLVHPEDSNGRVQVSKTRDLDRCESEVIYAETTPSVEQCEDCQPQSQVINISKLILNLKFYVVTSQSFQF